MRKLKTGYFLILFLVAFKISFAQQKRRGQVLNTSGAPLAGVSVQIKAGGAGVIIDKEGLFVINAKPDDVQQVNSVGFEQQIIKVTSQPELEQGRDPYVMTDDGNVVPQDFVFSGKATTDIYGNIKMSKILKWYVGVDNVFNVHPDVSVMPNARSSSWCDSESGGPFDAVQMDFNGTRLFTKIALNL